MLFGKKKKGKLPLLVFTPKICCMHISLMRDLSVYYIHCQLDIADLSPSVLENKTTDIIMGP
jgi:hypothetical protein